MKKMNIIEKIIFEMTPEELKFDDISFAFSQEFHKILAEKNINQAELAKRLSVSEACVSKMLGVDANLTLKTIAKLLVALAADMKLEIVDYGKSAPCMEKETNWQGPIKGTVQSYIFINSPDIHPESYEFALESKNTTRESSHDETRIAAA